MADGFVVAYSQTASTITFTKFVQAQYFGFDHCCVGTSDSESTMLQAVHSDDTNSIQVVVVHNLELLPHDWPGLTL